MGFAANKKAFAVTARMLAIILLALAIIILAFFSFKNILTNVPKPPV